jgi:hypothetical protein
MDWINLHIPTVIRSPEYVGSSPAERGTWLCVLAYACEIESGGRLPGASTWKDRQWQQACGVTLREVRAASRLLRFDGQDLIVNGYPVAKQRQVQQARGVGMAGAMARWGKRDADRNHGGMPTGIGETMPTGMPTGNAEGEGEGEGEGELRDGMPSQTPTPPGQVLEDPKAERRKILRRELLVHALPASDEAVDAWGAALQGAGAEDLTEALMALRLIVQRARSAGLAHSWPRQVQGLIGDCALMLRQRHERLAAQAQAEAAPC